MAWRHSGRYGGASGSCRKGGCFLDVFVERYGSVSVTEGRR